MNEAWLAFFSIKEVGRYREVGRYIFIYNNIRVSQRMKWHVLSKDFCLYVIQ